MSSQGAPDYHHRQTSFGGVDRLHRIVAAFTFVIVRSETYAVNHAALRIQPELDGEWGNLDHTVTWDAVYGVLTHSAMLSRIFWPTPRRRAPALTTEIHARGLVLRTWFHISDESPMHDRAVVTSTNRRVPECAVGRRAARLAPGRWCYACSARAPQT